MTTELMTPDAVADLATRLLVARGNGDYGTAVGLVDGLFRTPKGNMRMLVLELASRMRPARPRPGDAFYRLNTVGVDADTGARVERSSTDLPPDVAVFGQIMVAMLNDDPQMASDLFVGYVGDDVGRAFGLAWFALVTVSHALGMCRCQRARNLS